MLSPLAVCIDLSSLPWTYTSKPLIANSTQSFMDIKPLPPFLGIYNLSISDFGCNVPYIVNNFLVYVSIACSSLFLQLANAAEYLNRDTAQVLTPQTKLPPFSFDFKAFLNILISSFETFNFTLSSKNLSVSKIPKYL